MSFCEFTRLSFLLSLGDNKQEAEARKRSEPRLREAVAKAPPPLIERRPSAFVFIALKRRASHVHPVAAALSILCAIAGMAWVITRANILR